MPSLAEYYHDKAASFLKTVVCFDDNAYEKDVPAIAKKAEKQDDGFSGDRGDIVEEVQVANDIGNANKLEAKELTDAFASKEILCSVIKPDQEAERAKAQIVHLARTADVTILDWDLYKDTAIARNSVVTIVKEDIERGGRLRLLVIYSAENGPQVIDELFELLTEYGFTKNADSSEIRNGHALVVFFQKPDVLVPTAEVVSYENLPERIIQTFSQLTSGLLSAAALTAISEIRDKTHHLLATFSPTLDGAFIAHRCLIPDPNDAEQFALDLISGEIGTLLNHSDVGDAINAEQCKLWVKEKDCFDAQEKERLTKAISEYSRSKADGFRKLFQNAKFTKEEVASKVTEIILETKEDSFSAEIEAYRQKSIDSISAQSELFSKLFESDPLSDRETAEKIISLLYKENIENMAKAKENLSIISTIDTSIRNINIISKSLPRLHLGSVVKETISGKYLLCIQPLCDSIRIKHNKDTLFPFLHLDIQQVDDVRKILDICVPSGEGAGIWLSVAPAPNNLIVFPFRAKSATEAFVEATKVGGVLNFRTFDAKILEWVADLKIGKAQRIVSQLAARIHTLGIDEFEWMRLHQAK